VFRLFITLLIVFCLCELTLLLGLANYTSWKVPLLEVLATALLGLAVLRYVRLRFGRGIAGRLVASESPGDVLLDGAILVVAGILLIGPGVVSDVAGLLLLIPPVRWVIVPLIKRRYSSHFHTEADYVDLSDDPSEDGAFGGGDKYLRD
jgi:UPF0716 protein FxsA